MIYEMDPVGDKIKKKCCQNEHSYQIKKGIILDKKKRNNTKYVDVLNHVRPMCSTSNLVQILHIWSTKDKEVGHKIIN